MSPRRGHGARAHQRDAARERETLERRFFDRIAPAPELAPLVTARRARREPFHRWLDYRQGFAPELVRRFLAEARPAPGPLLDPFNGSGTVTTECAREGRRAVGTDAVRSLAWLARAPFLRDVPAWPEAADFDDLARAFAAAGHPGHRAAVLLAAARTTDGEGHRRADKQDAGTVIAQMLERVREDTAAPPPCPAFVLHADARRLPLADAGLGGALTSPPYLSRYDYTKVNDPIERLLTQRGRGARRKAQVRAATSRGRGPTEAVHPAAEEAAEALAGAGAAREAKTVSAYFADMARVLGELARVLRPEAPLWIVVAGAEVKRVYVPADLILAELAARAGFTLEGLQEARRMKRSGRRLGGLGDVAPREVVLRLRRGSGDAA